MPAQVLLGRNPFEIHRSKRGRSSIHGATHGAGGTDVSLTAPSGNSFDVLAHDVNPDAARVWTLPLRAASAPGFRLMTPRPHVWAAVRASTAVRTCGSCAMPSTSVSLQRKGPLPGRREGALERYRPGLPTACQPGRIGGIASPRKGNSNKKPVVSVELQSLVLHEDPSPLAVGVLPDVKMDAVGGVH